MKRYTAVIALVMIIGSLLSGCGFWMDGNYVSETPHQNQNEQVGAKIIEISSYRQMRGALIEQISSGAESCIMSHSASNEATVHFFTQAAVDYVLENDPIAAFAVNQITFEIGTNRGEAVIAFQMDYRHGRSEILRIQQTADMEGALQIISTALNDCDASVVLQVDSYTAMDFTQFVEDYANENPDIIMEKPQVSACVYPQKGSVRIIELTFTYQTSRDLLRQMQETVKPIFTSAELYVQEVTQIREAYSQLYSFLMERFDYTVETSITPTYSLLYYGVGDSRAFANVYAQMCRRAGFDCKVVTGTKAGEPWCWNAVRFRGEYYHVDLLQCSQSESFQMLHASEMTGYVWDYSAYETQ